MSTVGIARGRSAASYYYAHTRLAAEGRVRTREAQFEVTGTAWLDREWSTSARRRARRLGLDLASARRRPRPLMLYRLRRKDGSAGAFSKGALILPDGARVALSVREFALEPRCWWISPTTGVRYPVAWSIAIPSQGLSLDIASRLDVQELDLSVRYWEGAVIAEGRVGGGTVTAQGYLELAGY